MGQLRVDIYPGAACDIHSDRYSFFLRPGSTGSSALVGSRRVGTSSDRDSTGSVWLRIPGLEEVADERFPSSGVRHEIDLAGFTVAVIGTAGIREAIFAARQSAV